MNSYDSKKERRSRQQEGRSQRDARRTERMQRKPARSVGADSLAAPQARALGLARPDTARSHDRGETVRRVEQARAGSYVSRPAVFTQEAKKTLPRVSLSSFSVPTIALVVLILAVAAVLIVGPARTYYAAWRESGILQAEYDALAGQNADLTHELDRLQTLEGIEDEARSRGYVYPDEEAVIVSDVEERQVADPARVEEAIRAHEKNLPWYVPLLDNIFGYKRE